MNTRDTALLIIDMQRDFVTAGSPLCVAGAAATVPAIAALLECCRRNGDIAIFHVIREYDPSGIDLERSRLEQFQGVPGAVRGTPGAEIVPELRPLPGEMVIVKPRCGEKLDGGRAWSLRLMAAVSRADGSGKALSCSLRPA